MTDNICLLPDSKRRLHPYRVRTSPYLACGRFSCALWRVAPPFAEDGTQRKYGGILGIVRLQSAIRLQQN